MDLGKRRQKFRAGVRPDVAAGQAFVVIGIARRTRAAANPLHQHRRDITAPARLVQGSRHDPVVAFFNFPAVAPSPTQTTVSSSVNPSLFGQSVTFTATVTGTFPTGSVAFVDGSTTLATIPLTSGSAQWTTSALSVGASVDGLERAEQPDVLRSGVAARLRATCAQPCLRGLARRLGCEPGRWRCDVSPEDAERPFTARLHAGDACGSRTARRVRAEPVPRRSR